MKEEKKRKKNNRERKLKRSKSYKANTKEITAAPVFPSSGASTELLR